MPDSKKLTVSDIADVVIGLLAVESGISAGELRAELEAAGPQMPVDSLLLVEVLTKVEDVCGVRIQVDADVARSTRSVMTLARKVHQALPQGEVR